MMGLAAIVGRNVHISGKLFQTFDETLLMSLGASLFIIGLTIVAIGNTLPEMTVQLSAIFQKKGVRFRR